MRFRPEVEHPPHGRDDVGGREGRDDEPPRPRGFDRQVDVLYALQRVDGDNVGVLAQAGREVRRRGDG